MLKKLLKDIHKKIKNIKTENKKKNKNLKKNI